MFISRISQISSSIEDAIPRIGVHVTDTIITHDENYLMSTILFRGIPFEAIEENVLENNFLNNNQIFADISKKHANRLALWSHITQERMEFTQQYHFKTAFTKQFAEKYLQRFSNQKYFETKFYLTVCLKYEDEIETGIRELEEVTSLIEKTLIVYEPKVLSIYEEVSSNAITEIERLFDDYQVTTLKPSEFVARVRHSSNSLASEGENLRAIYEILNDSGQISQFSEILEFYSLLVNGKRYKVPLAAERGYITLPRATIYLFYNYLQTQHDDDTEDFFTAYDLKSTPAFTKFGQYNDLLACPFEFIMTFSFLCMSVYDAQKAIQDQINKLNSVADKADKQIKELNKAYGFLSTGALSFGDFHGALLVKGESYRKAVENGTTATSILLGSGGSTWTKARLSSPMTWLSQIPTYKSRPRSYMKPSTTLASLFSMHNYSTGKAVGNPIGDGTAVMPLQTVAKSLYNFSFHPSRMEENNTGEKLPGHAILLGATGTGKTTTETALVSMLERFNPRFFAADQDEGMRIFMEAVNGVYFRLKAGEDTGLAPFQLPDTRKNRDYLYQLVEICGKNSQGRVDAEEESQIKVAVDTIFTLDRKYRRFARLLETIPDDGADSLHARLTKWCQGGRFGWALDNVESALDLDSLAAISRLGFDVTDFLKKGYEPTEPVLSFLFHTKELMQEGGGLMATIYEEFWLPAMYETTQAKMLKTLKTGRKLDEFGIFVSQSPADAINSPIFAALIEQTPTKIYLPNPSANYEDYARCHLTKKEFYSLKRLTEQSRTFLVKQGNQSCFATLDLHGMDDELAVMSGSSDNVALLEQIQQEIGSKDPAQWMSIFQKRRAGKR